MFITLAVFAFLCLLPIMLSQSLPFHMIREKDRYIETEKLFTTVAERVFLWIAVVIITPYIVTAGYFTEFMERCSIYVKIDILLLSIFYFLKIGKSLTDEKPVAVFINYSLYSRKNKLGIMIIFLIFALAVLESMNIIM